MRAFSQVGPQPLGDRAALLNPRGFICDEDRGVVINRQAAEYASYDGDDERALVTRPHPQPLELTQWQPR